MNRYQLSKRAESELTDIFIFGIERFGFRQADTYVEELKQTFQLIADYPAIGTPAPEIGSGIRRRVHVSHVVLYDPETDPILVHAIVHGSSASRMKL